MAQAGSLRSTDDAPLPSLSLSRRATAVPEALSIYINQLVYDLRRRGRDIVTLSLGEAFFDIPLFDFRKLDLNECYHYSDSQGIPRLRHKIADYYQTAYAAPVDADRELLITAGSKPAIFMAMMALLDPGDEVLIHEPAWLSYREQARLIDAHVRFIPFDTPLDAFGAAIGPRTKLLILNNPNNPAGRLYTRQELETIYWACRSRGVFVLVDEAYSDFVLDEPFVSMCNVVPEKDGIVVVNSLSKNLGMSGWRVGYAIAQEGVLEQMLKLNQHLITCAPSILLHYLARYFDDIIAVTLPQVRDVVEKRRRVAGMLKELRLATLPGASTFYFFVSIGDFPASSIDFALQLLLRKGVAVVPGSAYGGSTERYVRISIGTESEERIYEALCLVKDLVSMPTFQPAGLDRLMQQLGLHRFSSGES